MHQYTIINYQFLLFANIEKENTNLHMHAKSNENSHVKHIAQTNDLTKPSKTHGGLSNREKIIYKSGCKSV